MESCAVYKKWRFFDSLKIAAVEVASALYTKLTMNIPTTVSLLLSMIALAFAAPTPIPTTVCRFLSDTGRFLTMDAEGKVSADGDFGEYIYIYL